MKLEILPGNSLHLKINMMAERFNLVEQFSADITANDYDLIDRSTQFNQI